MTQPLSDRIKALPKPYQNKLDHDLTLATTPQERVEAVEHYEEIVEGLHTRYIPTGDEPITEDDFIQRGVELVGIIRVAKWLLGHLLDYKFSLEGATEEESKRDIVARYAPLWSTSETSLWRYWVNACKFPQLPRPLDMTETALYEILSSTDDQAEADRIIDLAIMRSWGVMELREIKHLLALKLIDGWYLPDLFLRDNVLMVSNNGKEEVFGSVITDDPGTLAPAAIALLTKRGRFKHEW